MGTKIENARLDMAADVLVTGVESGYIDYWAAVDGYTWSAPGANGDVPLPKGRESSAEADVNDRDNPIAGRHLDSESMLAAMRGIAADPKWAGYGWDGMLQGRIVQALNDPSIADFDAADADCIVQYQMFKWLVYG